MWYRNIWYCRLLTADRQEAYQHSKSYTKYAVLRALSLCEVWGFTS